MKDLYDTLLAKGVLSENNFYQKINEAQHLRIIFKADTATYFPYYDTIVLNCKTGEINKIEIKHCSYENLYFPIEYVQGGKTSGIHLSKADIYIFDKVKLGKIYWARKQEIINYIKINNDSIEKKHVKSTNSYFYRVPLDNLFKEIDLLLEEL